MSWHAYDEVAEHTPKRIFTNPRRATDCENPQQAEATPIPIRHNIMAERLPVRSIEWSTLWTRSKSSNLPDTQPHTNDAATCGTRKHDSWAVCQLRGKYMQDSLTHDYKSGGMRIFIELIDHMSWLAGKRND